MDIKKHRIAPISPPRRLIGFQTPWAVIGVAPSLQRTTYARFKNRGKAEGFARSLQRMLPNDNINVIYEASYHE